MPTHIGLPDEHAERIKRFAVSQNISMADAIGELIKLAIDAGKISSDLPGYSVTRAGHTVTVSGEDGYSRTMTTELANAFAATLRWFARPKGASSGSVTELAQSLSGAEHVGIKRQGAAIKIVGNNGKGRVLAPSIARELADLVERIATD